MNSLQVIHTYKADNLTVINRCIYEIAYRLGFGDDTAHFSKMFQNHTGILPSENRLQCMKSPGIQGKGNFTLPGRYIKCKEKDPDFIGN